MAFVLTWVLLYLLVMPICGGIGWSVTYRTRGDRWDWRALVGPYVYARYVTGATLPPSFIVFDCTLHVMYAASSLSLVYLAKVLSS